MRQTGVVKFFDNTKGFGFIAADDKSVGDCFVHYSAIQGEGRTTLTDRQRVEFDVEVTERGLRARNVVALDGDADANTPPASW